MATLEETPVSFRLLDLPKDLRLEIWDQLYSPATIKVLVRDPAKHHRGIRSYFAICRLIRTEALPIYLKSLRRELDQTWAEKESIDDEIRLLHASYDEATRAAHSYFDASPKEKELIEKCFDLGPPVRFTRKEIAWCVGVLERMQAWASRA